MEFIELADYPLPAGRVVEWLPTASSHYADWPRDHRAVSHNHENHLREALEHSRIRDQRHYWLGHTFRIDGPLDPAAWRATLDLWIDRHEVLRSHVAIEGGRPARYTVPPGDIRVRAAEAGAPSSTMATYRVVQRLLDDGTAPLRFPSYNFVTVACRDSFTVVFAADHSVMDGYSTITAGGELRAYYEAIRDGAVPPSTGAGSYLDFCEHERGRAATATETDPAVEIWRDFFADETGDAPSGGPFSRVAADPVHLNATGDSSGRPVWQRNLAIEVLDADGADAAATAGREHGQGLFAVLLAAFAATTTEFGAGRDFRTVVPLHTRSEAHWADSLGWFVGLAPFRLDSAGAHGMAELVAPTGTELRRVRAGATVPFARVCELLEQRPRISFMVSYMDIRAAAATDTWVESDTRWLRSRNVSTNEYFFWFLRTPTGVTLNMRYPGTTRATRDIHRHVLRLREMLTEFVHYGDAHIRPSEGAPLSWR